MAYYVDRTVKMTWWERSYLPEIIRGMCITSRHFFVNLFGFIPFFLGQKKKTPNFYRLLPRGNVPYPDRLPRKTGTGY